jgi:cytidylate kinase
MAADAVEIDSTALSLDEVIGLIVGVARERAGLTGRGQQPDTARTG